MSGTEAVEATVKHTVGKTALQLTLLGDTDEQQRYALRHTVSRRGRFRGRSPVSPPPATISGEGCGGCDELEQPG